MPQLARVGALCWRACLQLRWDMRRPLTLVSSVVSCLRQRRQLQHACLRKLRQIRHLAVRAIVGILSPLLWLSLGLQVACRRPTRALVRCTWQLLWQTLIGGRAMRRFSRLYLSLRPRQSVLTSRSRTLNSSDCSVSPAGTSLGMLVPVMTAAMRSALGSAHPSEISFVQIAQGIMFGCTRLSPVPISSWRTTCRAKLLPLRRPLVAFCCPSGRPLSFARC